MAARDRTHTPIPLGAYMSRDPRIIPALLKHVTPRGDIWEPACGEGHLVMALSGAGCSVHASDIVDRTDLIYKEVRDFFTYKELISPYVRTICTNMDNAVNVDFTRHAIELMRPVAGMVCMYQRHNWGNAIEHGRVFDLPCYAGRVTCRFRPIWFELRPGDASPYHTFDWFIWDWQRDVSLPPWEKFA